MRFGVDDRHLRRAKLELTSANIELTRAVHSVARAPDAQKERLRREAQRAADKLRAAEELVRRLAEEPRPVRVRPQGEPE